MPAKPRVMRECECDCHCADIQCDDCKRCVIQDKDVLSIETMDNLPGAGRGMDIIFQYLGARLDRFLGVTLDKLGYGPVAEERNALSAIAKLSPDHRYHLKVVRGKRVVRVISEAEVLRAERRIMRSCKKLAKHLRSAAPTTQLNAMDALWRLRCADPLRVDDTYRELDLYEELQSIHGFLSSMDNRSSSNILALWKSEYFRPYDDDLLDALLASSRKALIAFNDNELHSAAKSLLQLKGGYNYWTRARCLHAAPRLQTLSKFLLDPDLAFIAIAYIGRLGMARNRNAANKNLLHASASIVQNLRAICSFHVNRVSQGGKSLPDAYWNVRKHLDWIDTCRVFLPESARQLISAAPLGVDSSIVVDWQELERAITQAEIWLTIEFINAARSKGYHNFLERQQKETTGISQQTWELIEHLSASYWFNEIMERKFKRHYTCAECINQGRCKYWFEAFDCYYRGGINKNEVIQEFRKNSKKSFDRYALAQMNEWERRTMFTHEQGQRALWLKRRSH